MRRPSRASLSNFPFLGKFSNRYERALGGAGGSYSKFGKSVVFSSRPPLEPQTEYYYRCRGEARIGQGGSDFELGGGIDKQVDLRDSLSNFPFPERYSGGAWVGESKRDSADDEKRAPDNDERRGTRNGKSVVFSSIPPLEIQEKGQFRCRGETSTAHGGSVYMPGGDASEQEEVRHRHGGNRKEKVEAVGSLLCFAFCSFVMFVLPSFSYCLVA
ncbi:hypothetical protein U1Q18_030369 [Sarracenia purpurea var. burkii]